MAGMPPLTYVDDQLPLEVVLNLLDKVSNEIADDRQIAGYKELEQVDGHGPEEGQAEQVTDAPAKAGEHVEPEQAPRILKQGHIFGHVQALKRAGQLGDP